MAVISGKDGVVTAGGTAILQITGFSFSHSSANDAYATNNTGGYKARVAGVKDWSGTVNAKYDASIVPVVGSTYALVLSLATGENASGNAIVDSVNVDVDINDGKAVSYVLNFSGNGALTMPS